MLGVLKALTLERHPTESGRWSKTRVFSRFLLERASQASIWGLPRSLRTDFFEPDPTVATRGPENGLGAEIAEKKIANHPQDPEMS